MTLSTRKPIELPPEVSRQQQPCRKRDGGGRRARSAKQVLGNSVAEAATQPADEEEAGDSGYGDSVVGSRLSAFVGDAEERGRFGGGRAGEGGGR